MTNSPFDTPEYQAYADRFRTEVLPNLADSAVSAVLFSGGDDVQQATEIGFSLLLGKPLLLIVLKGATIPDGLKRAADCIIVADDVNEPHVARDIADFLKGLEK